MNEKLIILRSDDGWEYDLHFLIPEDIWKQGGVVERAQACVDFVKNEMRAEGEDIDEEFETYKSRLIALLMQRGFVPPADVIKEGPRW